MIIVIGARQRRLSDCVLLPFGPTRLPHNVWQRAAHLVPVWCLRDFKAEQRVLSRETPEHAAPVNISAPRHYDKLELAGGLHSEFRQTKGKQVALLKT